ncbi:hypothetical protein SUGI_0967240 [Cryptomeria japonica]|uniref:ER-bound oxygenase mpaB n=1 Tax=Cryptomeria japonica TaxID=3369 RepID=UPI002414CD0C|nr:ER-bound oxygenase mpaB [Cryptomeria japonica]GLJ45939.1 hypothetical protein SUGI_0967240 [Cryptomeria japonica]
MNSQAVKTHLLRKMPDILCFVCLVLVLWKASCLFFRAKRRRYLASLCPTEDALLLYKLTNYVEFSFLSHKALEFALFRTFAIPSISKLLHSTQEFCPSSILKRYDDTGILTQEFVLHHVDSHRGSLAIQRLNFIHAHYNISNADLLYTLSLFFLEPIRFTAKYGYRNWTEGEKQAQFVVWHGIGKRMDIKHIPHNLGEMEAFSGQYEAQQMVYSESNRVIGDATLDLLLSKVPASFRPFARRVAYALFDERLVKAMGYPPQPYWLI